MVSGTRDISIGETYYEHSVGVELVDARGHLI